MNGIPLYEEINDLHRLTGSALRTKNPLFHCFDMRAANDLEVTRTEPHRASFYTLALSIGTQDLSYTLNETVFSNLQNFILCVAPGQIAQWKKEGDWLGYCSFFKSEFLLFSEQTNFLQQYPFFNISETNIIPVDSDNLLSFKVLFEQVLREQESGDLFSTEVMQACLQAILWKVRRLYEKSLKNSPSRKAAFITTAQFQYLVNQYFLSKTTVEEYANLLNITPNHLSQTIKGATGKTAKQIISQRRLTEAKYLLVYTPYNVSEIAYQLGFSEPTHFSKFFKQATAKTPQQYRKKAQMSE